MKTRSCNSLQYTRGGFVLPEFNRIWLRGLFKTWPMKSSDNGYNSHVESETLRPLCVVLVSAPHWFRLCQALITISSCSASLLARCLRLVATWRSSREVDSVHWTPYKMKPDCRIFTFLILSFTLFQDTQGKFLRNSNTFYKISFFYIRLLILNGEFYSNFFFSVHPF